MPANIRENVTPARVKNRTTGHTRDTGLSLFRFTVKAQAMTAIFVPDDIHTPCRYGQTGRISRLRCGIRYFFPSGCILPFATAVFIHPEKHSGTGRPECRPASVVIR